MKSIAMLVLGSILVISGCAAQPGVNYYWGDYSETLYFLKKEPSSESEQRHMSELEEIISKSNEKNLRIPPGVQAELGYMYANRGDEQKARSLYQAEISAYPESRLFVEKLQGMVGE